MFRFPVWSKNEERERVNFHWNRVTNFEKILLRWLLFVSVLGHVISCYFATVHSRKFTTNPTHWKTYISLLPFQLVPGLFCFVNSFPVTEFSGLTLSLEIVCRFLNGGKNCFPQPLGCLHLCLSPQLVVVGELVPGLGSHATLHGSGGVWMEANVGGIVVQFQAFTVDIKCDVFVR